MFQLLPLPKHVAVIMDGNRRWAEERDLPVIEGHKEGREVIEEVMDAIQDLGVKYVTFWALSLDNMAKRSEEEIKKLMDLFEESFLDIAENEKIHSNKVKINVLGRWRSALPERVVGAIQKAVEKTKNYSNSFLNFLVCYSGRDEMLQAIENIAERAKDDSNLDITPELVKENLFASDLPPVDLLIRTGGEPHNSTGFMMWDTANSQYSFPEVYWPDFSGEKFKEVIKEYRTRRRLYGE